jgi:hypothetical protein
LWDIVCLYGKDTVWTAWSDLICIASIWTIIWGICNPLTKYYVSCNLA